MKWEYEFIEFDKFLNSEKGLTTEEKLKQYEKKGWEFIGILQKPYSTVINPPKLDSDSLVFKIAIAE